MTKNLSTNMVLIGIPLGVLAFLVLLTRTAVYEANAGDLSIGITLDFLITIALLFIDSEEGDS